MLTISQKITVNSGRSTGFDYIRILLAFQILFWHSFLVCYGVSTFRMFFENFYRPAVFAVVPCFFALSGFLVAGSLVRVKNVPVFLTLRALRIFPALGCEVIISALVIGPLLTDRSLQNYFTSPELHAYFLNMVGLVHFTLPGVFTHNPFSSVNQQLWTIPAELLCYQILAALAILRVTSTIRVYGLAMILLTFVAVIRDWSKSATATGFLPTTSFVTMCFVCGVFLYLAREIIPYKLSLCIGSLVIIWLVLMCTKYLDRRVYYYYLIIYLAPCPIAYVTTYLGLTKVRKIGVIASGDYSYGIYLYGFPIQQAIVQLLPSYRVWYMNLVLSLLITGLFAWLSWRFVESRILSRRVLATQLVDSVYNSVNSAMRKVGVFATIKNSR